MGSAEISSGVMPFRQHVTAIQELSMASKVCAEILEVLIGTLVNHRSKIDISLCWVPNCQFAGQFHQAVNQGIINRFLHKHAEHAEHFCPCKPNAERTIPTAAASKSA